MNEENPNRSGMNLEKQIELCHGSLPAEMKDTPWLFTEHGRKILESDDEMNAYMAAYGEMHVVKCRAAMQNFPFAALGYHTYEIFDWGCGQGLATLTLLDMLYERGMMSRLRRIHLIEPSEKALARAASWVGQSAGPGIDVVPMKMKIPDTADAVVEGLECGAPISINLLSNILDIREISLSWLARKTSTLAGTNYMVCIGPKFIQNTNTRLMDFCGYFHPESFFSEIDSYPYGHTSRTHHEFGLQTRCFVHHRDTSIDLGYQECADDEACDYAAEVMGNVVETPVIAFYNRLREACGSSYDIFFRPAINCDTADFVLTSKKHGIVLINVCSDIDDLGSAFDRIEAVKDNLFSVHIRSLKADSVAYSSIYNCVKTALYFPGVSHADIDRKVREVNEDRNRGREDNTKDYFAYLCRLTDESDLCGTLGGIRAYGFKSDYYDELLGIISSKWHSFKDGDPNLKLSRKQAEIVKDTSTRLRVKGAAGCGKTQVVANRAVEQHVRTGRRVLIITYNISLIEYIRMRISQVPADFSPNMFEVVNYHQFFKSKARQYAGDRFLSLNDFDDPSFFEPYDSRIRKYQTIIIDEAQDFKEEWIQSVIWHFLSPDGSVSIFGDGEQNIYKRELDEEYRMPHIHGCDFKGAWKEMNDHISMRIQNRRIAQLCSDFAKEFLDGERELGYSDELVFDDYYTKYWDIGEQSTPDRLARDIIRILSQHRLATDDTVVLAQSIDLLREVDDSYGSLSGHGAMINFETKQQHKWILTKNGSHPSLVKRDLEGIRRAAKTHFTTSCSQIKMSTVHSFKGWEAKTVILILQPAMREDGSYEGFRIDESKITPELIYTALTRARSNLFILNMGNGRYHDFFNSRIGNQ